MKDFAPLSCKSSHFLEVILGIIFSRIFLSVCKNNSVLATPLQLYHFLHKTTMDTVTKWAPTAVVKQLEPLSYILSVQTACICHLTELFSKAYNIKLEEPVCHF